MLEREVLRKQPFIPWPVFHITKRAPGCIYFLLLPRRISESNLRAFAHVIPERAK